MDLEGPIIFVHPCSCLILFSSSLIECISKSPCVSTEKSETRENLVLSLHRINMLQLVEKNSFGSVSTKVTVAI